MRPKPDLLTAVYPDAKLHDQFKLVRDSPLYESARAMLREVFADFHDPDGNFIEQFQTTGFDQRTFELYLFAVFKQAAFAIDRSHGRPDFLLNKDGTVICVEAVTANPAAGPKPYSPVPQPRTLDEFADYLRNEIPIRLGSPLFSKLRQRYWELPHVAGKPIVFAIENFHGEGSLGVGYSQLANYLYGQREHWYHDEEGSLIITLEPIDAHRLGAKEIPSGFFAQPDAEHISAVLFSNSGTIPKFHRMGQQGPYRSSLVRIFRLGTCYNYEPNAAEPDLFVYEVGDPAEDPETWSEGTVLIRNPNALHPVPKGLIGAAAETNLESGQTVTDFLEVFHPYGSTTVLFPGDTPEAFISSMLLLYREAMYSSLPSLQAEG